MKYTYFNSPFGSLLLAGEKKLERLCFPVEKRKVKPGAGWIKDSSFFEDVISQLKSYFSGELKQFNLELVLHGTDFQKKVWQELVKIPYGKTISYSSLAERIGNPKACRAVGMANGKNPTPIIIPCHRVIGKDGSLTGFSSGLEYKARLLDLEKQN